MPLTKTPIPETEDPKTDHDTTRAHLSSEIDLSAFDLTFTADLDRAGLFGERILKIAGNRVTVTAANLKTAELDLPLGDVREARAQSYTGNGSLELALKDGRVVEAVRFTPALASEFSRAARIIESLLKEEEPPTEVLQETEKRVCKNCGLPLPEDNQVCTACIDRRATLMRLLGYALPYKSRAVLTVCLAFIGIGLTTITPILTTKVLTDQVLIPHKHPEWIGLIVFASIGLALASTAISIWRGRIASWLSTHMVYALRTEVYSKLQSLSLSYYDKRQAGSLTARVTQDVNELRNFLVDGVQFFFVNSLQILGILIIMLRYNWQLTLVALIPVPITVYLTRLLWRAMWKRLHRFFHLRSSLSGLVNTVLSGMRVVKAFAQEKHEEERFINKSRTLFTAELTVEQSMTTVFPLLALIATSGTYLINYFGGLDVYKNFHNDPIHGMTLGTLQLFLVYLGQLMAPIQGMTRVADWMSRSTAAAERVFEVVDADLEVFDAPNAAAMPRIDGRVELRNVRFSYDKNKNVLNGVSLMVEPGEMIGLVGHSGAGKSTIINLLSRFYDVTEGQILIDSVDIREIKTDDLRRQIGVVLQEAFLFPGTVRDNIAYARQDAPIEDVMRAARAANAHDFIMRLPDGYDTWVGERGARLSGGERQRISIARAILHDPRILILDEATASVNTETEKQIQEAITRLIKGRTTFAIAHRLSTLRDADRLVVIEKGKIAEMGTHDELLSKPEGVYRKLVDMQQSINKLKDEALIVEG